LPVHTRHLHYRNITSVLMAKQLLASQECYSEAVYAINSMLHRRCWYCEGYVASGPKEALQQQLNAITKSPEVFDIKFMCPLIKTRRFRDCSQVKVKVIIRPAVSRPVCPGIRPQSGTRDQFLFQFRDNIFRYSPFPSCGAPSLMKGQPYNLSVQLLLALPLLFPSPAGLATISYCLIGD
jgi:hypothetical protein